MKLKAIFGNKRIIGLAGEKHTGKTNNLISLIVKFRKENKETPIYAYGLPDSVMNFLKKLNVKEVSSLSHLVRKKTCFLVVDEFQKLRLNDRKHKDQLNDFVDFIYHNNVYVILCSPNLREFNNVIGGVIERWLLKNVRTDLCINGSQLKKVIQNYKGRYKTCMGNVEVINVPLNELLLINDEEEIVIKCKYIKEADSKKDNEKVL